MSSTWPIRSIKSAAARALGCLHRSSVRAAGSSADWRGSSEARRKWDRETSPEGGSRPAVSAFSSVDELHRVGIVALAGGGAPGKDCVDGGARSGVEHDVGARGVLLEPLQAARARNRDDARTLGYQPGDGELGQGAALL